MVQFKGPSKLIGRIVERSKGLDGRVRVQWADGSSDWCSLFDLEVI